MRLTIVTGGSRGDVQPYVALGNGFARAGHEVTVATYGPFEDFVKTRSLGYSRLSGDPARLVQAFQDCGPDPVCVVRELVRGLAPFIENNVQECLKACRGSDAVIYTPIGFVGSYVAQKLEVPAASAVLQPVSPTREFPSVIWPEANLAPNERLRGAYNRLTYLLTEQGVWQLFRMLVNRKVAKGLGLPRAAPLPTRFDQMRQSRELALCGWSPTVLPGPRDWGLREHVTGYWFLEHPKDWRPPADLEEFLRSGPPPVCVNFGSMRTEGRDLIKRAVLPALRSLGFRGLLVGRLNEVSNADLGDDVFKIEDAPHDWLFPKVRAVVHHGGAGTTGAVLRAGVPSVVVPFLVDQPFWGRRIERLGAGPAPIPRKSVTVSALAEALGEATGNPELRKRAGDLGREISAENGVARAVAIFEGYMNDKGRNLSPH